MTSSLVGSEMCIRDRFTDNVYSYIPKVAGAREKCATAARGRSDTFFTVSYTHLTLPTICSV
eukprot:12446781-Prorocentrum_lima.AAC.1